MNQLFALLIICCVPSLASARICDELERKVEYEIKELPFVADQYGPLGAIRGLGFQSVRQCPVSEPLWYSAVRSAELLGIPPDFEGSHDLTSLANEAVEHVPLSARIATVASRLTGSSDFARKAMSLAPQYRPAQRALAIALSQAGQYEEALKLSRVPHSCKEDYIVQARVLVAAGRISDGIAAARKAIASRYFDWKEPTPASYLDRDAYEILGFALLNGGHSSEAADAFRVAASKGSVAARRQLSH